MKMNIKELELRRRCCIFRLEGVAQKMRRQTGHIPAPSTDWQDERIIFDESLKTSPGYLQPPL